ncbi:MAG: LON peptidase substrate-binding domain-containing protein, partial [Rhodospirillales bacterium]|nr:LON peptidase substrate-binding domain-containing protein [Rhodospirillales bacterium]
MTDDEVRVDYVEGEVAEKPEDDASGPSRQLIQPDHGLPPNLHILPVGGRPFFPGQGMPIMLPEDPWAETIERISETPDHVAGVLLTHEDAPEIPGPADFYTVGTVVRIHEPKRAPGVIQIIAE